MENNRRVDKQADSLQSSKGGSFLASLFKRAIIKKFKSLKVGYIRLDDGSESHSFGDPDSNIKTSVTIISDEFYLLLGSRGLLGVAEAYSTGYWKADDLVKLIQIVVQNKEVMGQLESGWSKIFKPINALIHLRRKNSLSGSKKNILAHYDLSNDFYRLWLDDTMTYSCAFFKDSSTSLEDASIEKLDRICRKLKLCSDDSVLEIGTGWGSFAIHAASKYGCKVTSTTISDAQYNYAVSKVRDANLSDKISILKEDYRQLSGKYDKIVSIEMIEAVGHEYVPIYFKKVSELLKDDGFFALQGITYNDQGFDVYKHNVDFIKKYIFPGSCLISISQVVDSMKQYTDLSIAHLEDITMHYAKTLRIWRDNFLAQTESVRGLGFSQEFINMWEFYFVYCEAGFRERHIGDFQFIFSKPNSKKIKIEY